MNDLSKRLDAMVNMVVELSEAATSQAVAEALAIPMGAYLYRRMLDDADALVEALKHASDAIARDDDATAEQLLAMVEGKVAELTQTRDSIAGTRRGHGN